MKYIEVLYEESDHDKVFNFLKGEFGSSTGDVDVVEHIPGELVRIEWNDLTDPIDLATKMTETVPTVVIETESNSEADLTSRFFNGAQLW